MLVLSRKSMEAIVIGDAEGSVGLCKVTVLEIKNGSVRLGLDVADGIMIRCCVPFESLPQTSVSGPPACEFEVAVGR